MNCYCCIMTQPFRDPLFKEWLTKYHGERVCVIMGNEVYGTNHDIEHGVTLLKAKLLHDVVTGDDWIPTNDPPAPSRPLKSWLNDVNAIKGNCIPLQLLH